jgi:SAM-dependent methyltransferase
MSDASVYVHGTDPDEQRRLTRLNDLMNVGSLARLNIAPGMRIVDFGSGLGQLARAMARLSGKTVVGIERSEQQIAEARRQAAAAGEDPLLDLRPGSVLDPPLRDSEWGTFDLAHARFILEHVTDPLTVVRHMVRAVKPGGRIVLADDDHAMLKLWPEPRGLPAVWAAYMRTYDRLGNDPIIGRRLVELLHAAGAGPVGNDFVFFGSCAGHPDFPDFVANLIGVLVGSRAATLDTGGVTEAEWESVIASLREWGRRADAAMWYTMSWAEGRR